MWMGPPGESARLVQEALLLVAGQPHIQEFERSLRFEIDMLAQVDVGEPSLPQDTEQAIVTQLLPQQTIHHATILQRRKPCLCTHFTSIVEVCPDGCQAFVRFTLCRCRGWMRADESCTGYVRRVTHDEIADAIG